MGYMGTVGRWMVRPTASRHRRWIYSRVGMGIWGLDCSLTTSLEDGEVHNCSTPEEKLPFLFCGTHVGYLVYS